MAAGLAVALALWQLIGATAGLTISHARLGPTPVTLFQPAGGAPAPAVVIAHGFAGSQQLMRPFALTLARNGYLAVTFDFLGHGRNGAPLRGDLTEPDGAAVALLEELDEVVRYARGHPASDGRVALLGHSMAGDIVVRYAQTQAEIAATVAVSLFSPGVTPDSPRNLLVIVGALEPAMLKEEGRRVVGMAPGASPPREDVTYGGFSEGTARRLVLADGVEHIGVLYSRDSLAAALAWLDDVFGRNGGGKLATQGPWIVLLLLGLTVLARPLARLLPKAAERPLGAGLGWRRLLPLAIAPAVLTPLIAWALPSDFLPILIGDYLAIHFGLYGLLTAAGLWLVRRAVPAAAPAPVPSFGLTLSALAIALYGLLAIGLAIDRFAANFLPIAERLPTLLAILVGAMIYFLADEWLTRGPGARPGAYPVSKACFLLSLGIAVALDLESLFFLLIIVPVILVFFVIFGLFSRWAYRRCNHPLAAGAANALIFAWAISVTFPLVAG